MKVSHACRTRLANSKRVMLHAVAEDHKRAVPSKIPRPRRVLASLSVTIRRSRLRKGSPVKNVRLIYEQIETAKSHLLRGGMLDCRLALILLDNVAELLMARALRDEFDSEDFFYPKDGRARLGDAMRAKYTPEERRRAEREFEPKLRILGFRMDRISPEELAILRVCHRLRCEAFHAGAVRRTILSQTVVLLFQTTVALTLKLPIRSFIMPAPNPAEPDARFLERYELQDAMRLAFDDGREQIVRILMEGIALDARAFVETLSQDLVRRIDEDILGGLHYLNDRDADVDRNLQYGQFWQDSGIALAEAGVRQPRLDEAFEQWKAEGHAKYTVAKINRWRRQAELIARRERPSAAIEQWWAIDDTIQPLETGIRKAVAEYDEQINAEIHDRRI